MQEHPFDQIPPAWLHQLPDLVDVHLVMNQSISGMCKQSASACDESQGPAAGSAGKSSASLSKASSSRISGGSQPSLGSSSTKNS
jgi:hypothetical protein